MNRRTGVVHQAPFINDIINILNNKELNEFKLMKEVDHNLQKICESKKESNLSKADKSQNWREPTNAPPNFAVFNTKKRTTPTRPLSKADISDNWRKPINSDSKVLVV